MYSSYFVLLLQTVRVCMCVCFILLRFPLFTYCDCFGLIAWNGTDVCIYVYMEPASIGECTFVDCTTLGSMLHVVYYYNAPLMTFIPICVFLYVSAVYGICFTLAHELLYCIIVRHSYSLYLLRMHCTLPCIMFYIHYRLFTNFVTMGIYISGHPPMLCYCATVLQLYVTLSPTAE